MLVSLIDFHDSTDRMHATMATNCFGLFKARSISGIVRVRVVSSPMLSSSNPVVGFFDGPAPGISPEGATASSSVKAEDNEKVSVVDQLKFSDATLTRMAPSNRYLFRRTNAIVSFTELDAELLFDDLVMLRGGNEGKFEF